MFAVPGFFKLLTPTRTCSTMVSPSSGMSGQCFSTSLASLSHRLIHFVGVVKVALNSVSSDFTLSIFNVARVSKPGRSGYVLPKTAIVDLMSLMLYSPARSSNQRSALSQEYADDFDDLDE